MGRLSPPRACGPGGAIDRLQRRALSEMDFELRTLDVGLRVLDLGLWTSDLLCRALRPVLSKRSSGGVRWEQPAIRSRSHDRITQLLRPRLGGPHLEPGLSPKVRNRSRQPPAS